MSIFTRAKANEVYFRLGKFDDDVKSKFIHAPFDLLTLDGTLYLNARSFKAGGGLLEIAPWVASNDVVDEEWKSARDFFPIELNPVVMGEYEMGDWQGHPTDWTGMHRLGFI